jgi:hypothetical protein
LIGSDPLGRLQLGGVYTVLSTGDALLVKGRSAKRRLVDNADEVLASVTDVTGRERSFVDHSVSWTIETAGPNPRSKIDREPSRGPGLYTLSLERLIRSEDGDPLRWRDYGRGGLASVTDVMHGSLRDVSGKEVLSARTTYTRRRIGWSFRHLGMRMSASFEGTSQTISPLPMPVAVMTFHLMLNRGGAPEIGQYVDSGAMP